MSQACCTQSCIAVKGPDIGLSNLSTVASCWLTKAIYSHDYICSGLLWTVEDVLPGCKRSRASNVATVSLVSIKLSSHDAIPHRRSSSHCSPYLRIAVHVRLCPRHEPLLCPKRPYKHDTSVGKRCRTVPGGYLKRWRLQEPCYDEGH
jgi:hypothetical protein